MEAYYKKQNRPSAGIRSYEDYREMLEKENDIQGIVNITPDHQHASINISALKKGKAAIAHKPLASVLYEVRRTLQVARESQAVTHLLAYSNTPDRHLLEAMDQRRCHRHRPRSAQLDESPLLAAGLAGVLRVRPGRCRPASTGTCGRDPSRTVRITRTTPSPSIAAGTPTVSDASATWASTVSGSRTAS